MDLSSLTLVAEVVYVNVCSSLQKDSPFLCPMKMNISWHLAINPGRSPKSWSEIGCESPEAQQTSGETAVMTSSKIEIPGEVKSDPAALMASLQLMPSPVPNPEIKYTKVCSSPLLPDRLTFALRVTTGSHLQTKVRNLWKLPELRAAATELRLVENFLTFRCRSD